MIRVPTLVISSREDVCISPENSRYLAEHIPGARLVERPGRDHFAWRDPEVPGLVEEFLLEKLAFLLAKTKIHV